MCRRTLSAVILLASAPAFGQALTVQEPVFESLGVGTTVNVPAGGSISVGGVGRAAAARSSYGPLRSRGPYARGTSASSVSAGVFVHDLDTMDAEILAAASGSLPRPVFTKGRYDDATSYAMSRRWGGKAASSVAAARTGATGVAQVHGGLTPAARPAGFDVDRLLALGKEAERRGTSGVAAIHYRLAAKEGSQEAARRLAALGTQGGVAAKRSP
jgi:hypothetical protein